MIQSFRRIFSLGFAFALVAACATGDDVDLTEEDAGGPGIIDASRVDRVVADTSAPPTDTSTKADTSSGCGQSCTTHSDCQFRCVAPTNGGVWCCEFNTTSCYISTGATCPALPVDGGTD